MSSAHKNTSDVWRHFTKLWPWWACSRAPTVAGPSRLFPSPHCSSRNRAVAPTHQTLPSLLISRPTALVGKCTKSISGFIPDSHSSPQFLAHVCCCQTAAWIKMPFVITKWHLDPCSHLVTMHGPKSGVMCPLFGGVGCPSSTMSPGLRSTSVASGILIHPAIWPQRRLAKNWEVPILGNGRELGPHVTQCCRGRGLPRCQVSSWSIQPFGHSAPMSQTGQTDRQWSDRIGRTVLQTVPKMAYPIKMPCGLWTLVGPGNHILDVGAVSPNCRGNF